MLDLGEPLFGGRGHDFGNLRLAARIVEQVQIVGRLLADDRVAVGERRGECRE